MQILGGVFNVVEIPSHDIEKAIDGKIMIDGSNIEGLSVSVHMSDMSLRPDIDSFKRVPLWDTESGRCAIMMCDIYAPDGKPSNGCTRSHLKVELAKMRAKGFSHMNVGFEPEFFLLKNRPKRFLEKADFIDESGYCSDEIGIKVLREIVFELERIGLSCNTCHHERSASQYEVTYKYSEAPDACDNILLVRAVIKDIAKKNGFVATFMPKPISNLNGSGLHTNISLVKDGKNAFSGKNGISTVARHFIGGVLTHARALSMLTNPTINSYKRLGVDGYEAPTNICWGNTNRSTMIRVPGCTGNAARIEIRSTDSTANPFVAIAGILAAGLDGINKKISVEPVSFNVYALSKAEKKEMGMRCLPSNLYDAISEFEKDEVVASAFSPELAAALITSTKCEIADYFKLVNSFDFDRYF